MELPVKRHDYANDAMEPSRWDDFELRDDDIVICTAYKAGTTWTQTICALLIFQDPELPDQLARLSPWLDLRVRSAQDVREIYAAQTHRRFIKTHTPLDGLPYSDRVTYLFCGRDPRDVFLSMRNHMGNMDFDRIRQLREVGGQVGEQAIQDALGAPPGPDELFRAWLTVGGFPWEQDGFPMFSFFNHARSYWDFRHLPNLHFLHYADLQQDLEGQMRRVADLLGITVEESRWPALVEAASFESVKARPERFAPEADLGIWKNTGDFFKQGTSGQYRDALSEESLALYEEIKQQRVPAELADWLERGSLAAGTPG